MTAPNGGLMTPGMPPRIVQIKEIVTEEDVNSYLRKQDWSLLAMYQRTDQVFEHEMRLVYVFAHIGR